MAVSKINVSVICVYDLLVDNVGAVSNAKFTGCTHVMYSRPAESNPAQKGWWISASSYKSKKKIINNQRARRQHTVLQLCSMR